jgi:hypothetical protein
MGQVLRSAVSLLLVAAAGVFLEQGRALRLVEAQAAALAGM